MASPLINTRRALLGAVLALFLASASGCAAATPTGRPRTYDGGSTNEPEPIPGPAPSAGPPDAAFDEDMQAAVVVVDDFWATHWSDNFTGTYAPPRVHGDYDASPGLTCGGEPMPPDNAIYCPDGDFVAWDGSFMATHHASGDSFVYLTIAHEWGHAIQNRLDPSLVSEAREPQADCLAGAAVAGAIEDGQLTLETGDTEEMVAAFEFLGDAEPWTDESSHGTAEQRLAAFELGASDGVAGCLPNS
jgi:predicted metalloprotease